MTQYDILKKFVISMEIGIPSFTGDDDGGLGFLDQPDEWKNANADEVAAAKGRVLEIAAKITKRNGYKLAALVARICNEMGDEDAAHIAEMVSADSDYIAAAYRTEDNN